MVPMTITGSSSLKSFANAGSADGVEAGAISLCTTSSQPNVEASAGAIISQFFAARATRRLKQKRNVSTNLLAIGASASFLFKKGSTYVHDNQAATDS